jgi:hypothetical protein
MLSILPVRRVGVAAGTVRLWRGRYAAEVKALAYPAAYDVHRAHVTGLCSDTTGIGPFTDLVDEVMTQEPYASARRVFRIVDNGSSHRGEACWPGSNGTNRKSETGNTSTTISLPHWQPPDNPRGTSGADHLAADHDPMPLTLRRSPCGHITTSRT